MVARYRRRAPRFVAPLTQIRNGRALFRNGPPAGSRTCHPAPSPSCSPSSSHPRAWPVAMPSHGLSCGSARRARARCRGCPRGRARAAASPPTAAAARRRAPRSPRAWAPLAHDGVARELVAALKFSGRPARGGADGGARGRQPAGVLRTGEPAALVPAPSQACGRAGGGSIPPPPSRPRSRHGSGSRPCAACGGATTRSARSARAAPAAPRGPAGDRAARRHHLAARCWSTTSTPRARRSTPARGRWSRAAVARWSRCTYTRTL